MSVETTAGLDLDPEKITPEDCSRLRRNAGERALALVDTHGEAAALALLALGDNRISWAIVDYWWDAQHNRGPLLDAILAHPHLPVVRHLLFRRNWKKVPIPESGKPLWAHYILPRLWREQRSGYLLHEVLCTAEEMGPEVIEPLLRDLDNVSRILRYSGTEPNARVQQKILLTAPYLPAEDLLRMAQYYLGEDPDELPGRAREEAMLSALVARPELPETERQRITFVLGRLHAQRLEWSRRYARGRYA